MYMCSKVDGLISCCHWVDNLLVTNGSVLTHLWWKGKTSYLLSMKFLR